jgi:hypothetical protein
MHPNLRHKNLFWTKQVKNVGLNLMVIPDFMLADKSSKIKNPLEKRVF